MGSTKASVLPQPVLARPTMSLPFIQGRSTGSDTNSDWSTRVNHNTLVYQYWLCYTMSLYCTGALQVITFSYIVSTNQSRLRIPYLHNGVEALRLYLEERHDALPVGLPRNRWLRLVTTRVNHNTAVPVLVYQYVVLVSQYWSFTHNALVVPAH